MEQKIKILIADENSEFRSTLKESLVNMGLNVVDEASNGIDLLTKIKKTVPDIVLIDIWLPKMDAIQVIQKSKSIFSTETQAPDFIVMSCCTNQNMFLEAIDVGAAYCMQKPFDHSTLF